MAGQVIPIALALLIGISGGSAITVATLESPLGVVHGAGLHWSSMMNGNFDDGLGNPMIMQPPVIPSQSQSAYVTVSLSVSSWSQWNGTANATGACDSPSSPPGTCNAYIGIWTPAAWDSYAGGGPMQPFWCYTGTGSVCTNVSEASFTTPSLLGLAGQPWEIVIWDTQPYGLVGYYQVNLFVNPYFNP